MKRLAFALSVLTLTAFAAEAQIRWNFSDGDAVADQTISGLANVPVLSRGNNIGAGAFIDGSSPSSYTGASGTNNAGAAAIGGALNPNTSTYFEFTLTPDPGFVVNVTGLQLGSRATASGPTLITLRSSADGFVADLAMISQAADSTWRLLTLPGFNISSDPGAPLTFRIYGSGGTATTSATINWRIDDINVAATAIPEPGTYMLLGIGALLCVQRFRRRRS